MLTSRFFATGFCLTLLCLPACGSNSSDEEIAETGGSGGSGQAGEGGGQGGQAAGSGGAKAGQGGSAGAAAGKGGAGGTAASAGTAGASGKGQAGAGQGGAGQSQGGAGQSQGGAGQAQGGAGQAQGGAGSEQGGAGQSQGGAGSEQGGAGQGGAGMGGAGMSGMGGMSGTGGAQLGWEYVAQAKVPFGGSSTSTVRMSAHPTEPQTIAFSAVLMSLDPSNQGADLNVCTTKDLGKMVSCIQAGMLDASSPLTIGFDYDPANGQRIMAALKPTAKAHLFTSTNGGIFFSEALSLAQFNSTPWAVIWAAGPGSELAVRTANEVFVSSDFGVSFPVHYNQDNCLIPGSIAAARGNLTIDAADHTTRLLACEGGGAQRCQGDTCEASVLPAGYKIDALALSPHDSASAVALASDTPDSLRLLTSSDGGKTFTAGQSPTLKGAGSGYLLHDPRPSASQVYAGFFTPGGTMAILRSSDKGQSWQDITPPAEVVPLPGAFFPVEFVVAADGALIARDGGNVIARLPPPACSSPADCTDPAAPFCDASGACVGCLSNQDCNFPPSCDPQTKKCADCVDDSGCTGRPEGAHCSIGSCVCGADADCAGSSLGSHCGDPVKVCGCAQDADCKDTPHPLCNLAASLCTDPCTKDADCFQAPGAAGPICDAKGSGLCVECLTDAACAGNFNGQSCIAGKNTCGCSDSSDCNSGVCDPAKSRCAECLVNSDCTNPATPACTNDSFNYYCVACAVNADCKTAEKPFCIVVPDNPLSSYCWNTATP